MSMDFPVLGEKGLQHYLSLLDTAVATVTDRFIASYSGTNTQFGEKEQLACRGDLALHLEFLRPVLEFGLLQPMVDYLHWVATALGTRELSAAHLPLSLDWLGEYIAENMAPSEAVIVVAALRNAKQRYQQGAQTGVTHCAEIVAPWPECAAFTEALLAGDKCAALAQFDACLVNGRNLIDVEQNLVQAALYRIGKLWQNNQVTVAQEHLATAIAQMVMTRAMMKSSIPSSNGRLVVLACVEGNMHAVGLHMVADAFQLAGWEVQILGANVPSEALIAHVIAIEPDLLGLSVAFAHQLMGVRKVITGLTQLLGCQRPPVIVGGLAINQFSALAGKLGADCWSEYASGAVAVAASLTFAERSR